jgi:hypothetical protein
MHSVPAFAAGVSSLPSTSKAFATTQAAWRFNANERVTLQALVEPLRALGCVQVELLQAPFAMLVHDWSKLTFRHPKGKRDLVQLTHETDVGYEVTAALLVSADDGSPLAPILLFVILLSACADFKPPRRVVSGTHYSRRARLGRLRFHASSRGSGGSGESS